MPDFESIGAFTASEMLCKQASSTDIAIIGAGPQALTYSKSDNSLNRGFGFSILVESG
jgi:hypothetical protein